MLNDANFNGPIVTWLNDYSPLGIVVTDAQLVIRGWNRWLEQHTGRSLASVEGRALFDVFPELVERRFDRFYCDVLAGQTKVLAHRFHRYVIKLPAKPEYPLREMQQTVRIAPLMEKDQVIGTITAIEDVSERVVREDELSTAREEAETANQAKDRFLAVLSHDLRTPMASILGWARLIRNRTLNDQALAQALETIERNAMVQQQLIEEIMDTSRIATGKLQLDVEPINVCSVVEAALDAVRPSAESKGVRVERTMPNEQRVAMADPKRLQQIVWNLVSNAVKFTPKGGLVSATLAYREDGFQIKITDTGVGISPEDIANIFEPLWQAEDSGVHGGLGLGLAIVRELVGLHGGSVRVESPGPGRGTTFTVELPWLDVRAGESHDPDNKKLQTM